MAELKSRHFKKLLGPLWWLFEPLALAVVYFFLTIVVFRSSTGEHHLLFILIAVITWRWFSQSVDGAPGFFMQYASILTRTNFPLMPLMYVYSSIHAVYFLAGLVVIFGFLVAYSVPFTANLIFLPLIIGIQAMFNLGLSSLVAKAGIHIKDLMAATWVFTSIWFYISPGIYPESLVPEEWKFAYDLNPWATLFPAYRAVLLDGTMPDLGRLAIWAVVFLVMMIVGMKIISRNRGKLYKLF
jgi:lipopolysaccharide transport system permease protein